MSTLTALGSRTMRKDDYSQPIYRARTTQELEAIRIGLDRAIQNDFLPNNLLTQGVIDNDQVVTKTTDKHFNTQKVQTLDTTGPVWVWHKRREQIVHVITKPLNYFSLSTTRQCYEFWVDLSKRRKVTTSRLPECMKMKLFVLVGYFPFLLTLLALTLALGADHHSLAILTPLFLTYVYAACRRNYIVSFAKAVRSHNLQALLNRLSSKSEALSFKHAQINPMSVAADALIIPLIAFVGYRATVAHIYYFDSHPSASYLQFIAELFY